MFTGIVEAALLVHQARDGDGLRRITLDLAPLADWQATRAGDSVALNGCCLTVANLDGSRATFEAVPQTLALTNLGELRAGDLVNVERALRAGARLDGHIVQGHVDQVAAVGGITDNGGQWNVRVDCGAGFAAQCIERGSVCVDGISLTIAELGPAGFVLAIIPHTREITNIRAWRVGTRVNLEADVIGKYVRRHLQQLAGGVTPELLRRAGFTP
ncbi:MAG: riboflavin synthase [Planctomycetes bacterium]|jgi:riboflavin synthase|nr:riboflavin synthase [Planctomycetota bacterium]MCL4731441.1 riboflavin synthase [Planctomycetota bacterium]